MPKFDVDIPLEQYRVGTFGFTAVNPEELGASGYTLADIVADCSGSTDGFTTEMEAALKMAVEALKDHPRADNMMVRLTRFDDQLEEVHGYMLVNDIDPTTYDGVLEPRGMTALFDGVISGCEAAANYGRTLIGKDYDANGIIIVLTDGLNNSGKYSAHRYGAQYYPDEATFKDQVGKVAKALKEPLKLECLESYISILIGVNCTECKEELEEFHLLAQFTQDFIPLEDAEPATIAKIGQFISESVSSQSEARGTGGPSQSIANMI